LSTFQGMEVRIIYTIEGAGRFIKEIGTQLGLFAD